MGTTLPAIIVFIALIITGNDGSADVPQILELAPNALLSNLGYLAWGTYLSWGGAYSLGGGLLFKYSIILHNICEGIVTCVMSVKEFFCANPVLFQRKHLVTMHS